MPNHSIIVGAGMTHGIFALIAMFSIFCVDDEALISMSLRETAFGAAFAVCDSRLFLEHVV